MRKTKGLLAGLLLAVMVILAGSYAPGRTQSSCGYKLHNCWFSQYNYCSGKGSGCSHAIPCKAKWKAPEQ